MWCDSQGGLAEVLKGSGYDNDDRVLMVGGSYILIRSVRRQQQPQSCNNFLTSLFWKIDCCCWSLVVAAVVVSECRRLAIMILMVSGVFHRQLF